jgi:hypothetical protein
VISSGSTKSPPGQSSPLLGVLSLAPVQVQLTGLRRTAEVDLSAAGGPVSWTAASSAPQVQISAQQGAIPKGGVYVLTLTMQPAIIQLPGQAQIAVTDATGRQQTISVSWTLALL